MAVVLLATTVRSAVGFGDVLIAVPLLTLFLPVKVAVPLAVLTTLLAAIQIVIQDWRSIHWRSAAWLVLATIPGIPMGLFVLRNVPEAVVQGVLGALIIAFAAYCLRHGLGPKLDDDRHAWVFGFVGGILGGAYGINGPPLVVYGAMRRWSREYFRGTLQAYFLPSSLLALAGYGATGLLTSEVSRLFLWSLPAVILATLLGRWLNRLLHPERFLDYIYMMLIAIGVLMLWQAFR